jgi:hypothetical protein
MSAIVDSWHEVSRKFEVALDRELTTPEWETLKEEFAKLQWLAAYRPAGHLIKFDFFDARTEESVRVKKEAVEKIIDQVTMDPIQLFIAQWREKIKHYKTCHAAKLLDELEELHAEMESA